MRKCLFLLILSAILFSCSDRTENAKNGTNSFCYWKTSLDFSEYEKSLVSEMKVDHMYVRYFDVDWDQANNEARPIAPIVINKNSLMVKNLTPSVFFKNRVFLYSSKEQLDSLAIRTLTLIAKINESFSSMTNESIQTNASEILIDCDWTEKTRGNFFYFIDRLKKNKHGFEITTTLRLWQYKDQKTAGIPPVKRILLMCYNLQSANEYGIQNSILSLEELKKYTGGITYPLEIDIALPAFAWAVVFRRQQFKGIISENVDSYKSDSLHLEKIAGNRYLFKEEMVIGDYFARQGDELRIEDISREDLDSISAYLIKELKIKNTNRITFFSWDIENINRYGTEDFKRIYSRSFN